MLNESQVQLKDENRIKRRHDHFIHNLSNHDSESLDLSQSIILEEKKKNHNASEISLDTKLISLNIISSEANME